MHVTVYLKRLSPGSREQGWPWSQIANKARMTLQRVSSDDFTMWDLDLILTGCIDGRSANISILLAVGQDALSSVTH